MKKTTKNEKGSSLVESALVMLTMTSMIIFIMDMGRMLLVEQFIAERARVTARQAALNSWTSDQTKNYLCYNATTGSGTGYMGLTPSRVTVTTSGTSTSNDVRIQVKVTGVQMFTWIPAMAGTYTAPAIIATAPAQSLGATN